MQYVRERLRAWATWSVARQDGQPWRPPSQWRYEERVAVGIPDGGIVPCNEEALEIEGAIAWIIHERYKIGTALVIHYRDHAAWGASMQAEHLRISTRTLFRYIEAGHLLTWEYLIDRALGLRLPQVETLRSA